MLSQLMLAMKFFICLNYVVRWLISFVLAAMRAALFTSFPLLTSRSKTLSVVGQGRKKIEVVPHVIWTSMTPGIYQVLLSILDLWSVFDVKFASLISSSRPSKRATKKEQK